MEKRLVPLAPLIALALAACGAGNATSNGNGDGALAVDAADTGDMAVPAEQPDMAMNAICGSLKVPARAFASGTTGTLRDDLAGDFTVMDQSGAWSFKGSWSGCESYVFIPDGMTVSPIDATSMWSTDLDALIAASPPNVHYFFVSRKFDAKAALASVMEVSSQLDGALATLPDGSGPGQKEWWRQHLHFVQQSARTIDGWLGSLLSAGRTPEGFGFAIDRFQRIRGLGSFGDVNRGDPQLSRMGQWPYTNNLAYAANPPIYFNYEAARQAALDAEKTPVIVTVYDHQVVSAPPPDGGIPDGADPTYLGTVYKDVQFPDSTAMKSFDTLEVDLTMNCPMRNIPEEANNCGAWDYIVNISFLGDDGMTWTEMARFISSYHRAGRYLVDASQFLPYLAKGGTMHMRYAWAPWWNEQPAETVMQFRLYNKGHNMRPTQSVYLFSGGPFNTMYDVGRMPISVMIPPAAKRVELRAIITGHGGATKDNCSEFCNHTHEFTVGGMKFTKDFPEVQDSSGCMNQIGKGAVPNQSGTWWFGRGGWCPGMQVDPWVVDVTAQAKPGQSVTVSYRGLFNGAPPRTGLGDIDMSSWLVIWE